MVESPPEVKRGMEKEEGKELCPSIHVKLRINDKQRTKLYKLGRFGEIESKWDGDYLSLRVDCEALKQLDPARVIVNTNNKLRIFDSIYVENDKIRLDTYGTATDIMTRLVDYIVDNDKKVFDVETLQYLYKLQDEVLENMRRQLEEEKREEEERRKREEEERRAREVLRNEIERYEREINDLNKQIEYFKEQLDKKNRKVEELKEIIKVYAEFIEDKGLTEKFVEFVKEKEDEKYAEELKEKYYLT